VDANPVHPSTGASRVVGPLGLLGEACTRGALVAAVLAAARRRAWTLNAEPVDEVQVAWSRQRPGQPFESGARKRQRIASAYRSGRLSPAAAGYVAVAVISALLGVLLVLLNGS
jgi:heme A synthase